MSLSDHSKDELINHLQKLEDRVEKLEATVEQKDEKIERLEKRLAFYENPNTPPSKQRSPPNESSADEADDENNKDARTDGGTVGRDPGHEPAFRTPPQPDDIVDLTLDTCPCCGDPLGETEEVIARLIEEIPEPQPIEVTQYNRRHYTCEGYGEESVASDPNCPAEIPRVEVARSVQKHH